MDLLFPLILVVLAAFMYFNIRKQKKRMTEVQEMQNSIATGARVQLSTGQYATVVDSEGEYADLEIATGIIARYKRIAIVRVVPTEEAAETYPGALTHHPEATPEELPEPHTDTYSDSAAPDGAATDNVAENPAKPTDDK